MAVNPMDTESYRKTTLEDLVNDAVERKDVEALKWLQKESNKKVDRLKDGVVMKVNKGVPAIRAEYAKKFLGYKPSKSKAAEKARQAKKEKAEKKRQDMFAKAFENINK